MSEARGRFRDSAGAAASSKYHWTVIVGVPLAAILFQVYVPRFFADLAYLELPLLVTVYFSLTFRSPVAGLLYGASVGLAQDSLARPQHPLGMYGIVKTLVGFFTAFVSQRFDVRSSSIRAILAFFFYFFHEFFYWVLSRALLGESVDFDPVRTLVRAALNGAVAAPLFLLLDKLKTTE